MSLTATVVAPEQALEALDDAIAAAKGAAALSPVTVVVPTNACGVMARRALGRRRGLVAVDMVTLNRLAELLAGPSLAAEGRSPTSTPVIELAVASALRHAPGAFAAVADHPSTVVALRDLHGELRLAGAAATDRLRSGSRRAREAIRVSADVTARLADDWYDEGDLYERATSIVTDGPPAPLAPIVVHLPHDLPPLAIGFLHALATRTDVRLVLETTGDPSADRDSHGLLDALGIGPSGGPDGAPSSPMTSEVQPRRVVTTTDADDEVRLACRLLLDAARRGIPFERMAVLWPAHRPYARLVEHHLTAAEIRWNGRPGTALGERLVCRLLLDLLDLDHRGLRRRELFSLLADVPARDAEGRLLRTASWERVSREAGIARETDWETRLAAYEHDDRWGTAAAELSGYVAELRAQLGPPHATRRWWDWADWCDEQLIGWLGRRALDHLPEPEYRAWEALTGALERLRHLDPVGAPVTRRQFGTTLAAELDATLPRQGRVGDGVTVGSLGGAVGLDLDLAVVLGAAEGTMPPAPAPDPLLSDRERGDAGLTTSDRRAERMLQRLRSLTATADVTVTIPRGDLRATVERPPSRWLAQSLTQVPSLQVASHTKGLATTEFPASPSEHRLRHHLAHVRGGRSLAELADQTGDRVLGRGLTLARARRSERLTVYDGDLSSVRPDVFARPIAPTRLEAWTACPHAFFMRDLLGVYPIEEPDDEITITPLERGSLHHEALDRFHRDVIEGRLPQPDGTGWTDAHRQALRRHLADVCEGSELRGRTGRPAFWADEQERMLADLDGWLDHDHALVLSRRARVLHSELAFGGDGDVALPLPDGRSIAVRGVVDRIDALPDGSLVVTDHKTGSNKFTALSDEDPTIGCTAFQLPAYAVAARVAASAPAAPVRAEYGMFDKGDYARPGIDVTIEVEQRIADATAAVVAGIEAGFFPNRPARPGFRLWVECEYCEPDHLGTTELWASWERKRHDPRLAPWFAPDDLDDADD
jgi:ATP-dependent helicase/nuclease subunit B